VKFVHEDRDFDALLGVVAGKTRLSKGLVEKDYWVTHSLWALHHQGFDVWFKGGTSLSKGFHLIERFSEDLDLKIEPGAIESLPSVTNWKSEGTKATTARKEHFRALAATLTIAGTTIALEPVDDDHTWRSANLRVEYPGLHRA
jgi:Nucleotidyl transferase AbiEii toxin, Type IV TA system